MAGGDWAGVRADGSERDLGMVASLHSRIVAKALNDGAHEPGGSQPGVKWGYLVTDDLPPRLGHRRVAPQGGIGQLARMGRHDQGAVLADGFEKRVDHGPGAA